MTVGAPGDQLADEPRPCYRHPDRLTHVSCVRCGRPICPEDMRPASVGFQCPEEVRESQRTVREARTTLGGRVRAGRDATSVLIGLNVVVFVIMLASGASPISGSISALFARFALLPDRIGYPRPDGTVMVFQGVAHGDYYRLVTSQFLHFGIFHILTNMYVLYVIGPPLERALGRSRFVALYLVAGIGGGVASYAFGPPTEIAAGASGAIFGLFGAFYVVARRMGGSTGPVLGIIALNLFISVAVPRIDIRAHLGGLITGALLGVALAYAPRDRRALVQGGGFTAVALVLAAITAVRTASLS